MAKYVYLAADLLTGVVRDEVPFSSVSFSSELSLAGGFDATVSIDPTPPEHISGDAVINRITLANLEPGRTVIWVLRDGVPMWGGIIWAFEADLEQRVVRFAGKDFFSYYGMRTINNTTTWVAGVDDQFTIVEELIAYAAAQGGGDIGTTVVYESLTGRTRDRTYYYFEHKTIAEAILQLAAVDDGFDFAIDYSGSQSAGLEHQLSLAYPRRGRTTNLTFDTKKNVRLLSWSQDALASANKVWAMGSGEGDNMVQTSASDPSKLASFPLLETVTQHKDVTEQQTIIDHATQDLRRSSSPVESVEVEVRPDDEDGGLGSFIVGDTVRVIAQDGFVDIDQPMRVMGRTVSVDANGLETMRVRCASVEGTS